MKKSWNIMVAVLGLVVWGGGILAGVIATFNNPTSSWISPWLALASWLIGLAMFLLAIAQIWLNPVRDRIYRSQTTARIVIPFNRAPDALLALAFLAFLPEVYLWIELVEKDNRIGPSAIFGATVVCACLAICSLLIVRKPIVLDQHGMEHSELWHGKVNWEDLADVSASRSDLFLVHQENVAVSVHRRSFLRHSAKVYFGKILVAPFVPRYVSTKVLCELIRKRAGMRIQAESPTVTKL